MQRGVASNADRIEARRRVDTRGKFAGHLARRQAQPIAVGFVARRTPVGALPVEESGQRQRIAEVHMDLAIDAANAAHARQQAPQ